MSSSRTAALIPPWLVPAWVRRGWTFEISATSLARSFAARAARIPEIPAPTIRTEWFGIVSLSPLVSTRSRSEHADFSNGSCCGDASALQPQRQCALQLVEPRAVVPEDLALGLLRQIQQLEESVDGVRVARVVVGPVGGHHEVVVAHLGDDVLRQRLFRLDGDEALATE